MGSQRLFKEIIFGDEYWSNRRKRTNEAARIKSSASYVEIVCSDAVTSSFKMCCVLLFVKSISSSEKRHWKRWVLLSKARHKNRNVKLCGIDFVGF
jgi:hypothetical protein